MARETNASFNDVVLQLKITNRLLTAQLKAGGQFKQMDLVALLSGTGASPREIADVLDTTPQTVQTTIQRLKKKSAKQDGADNG